MANKEDFIAKIAPLAQEVQRKYGVPASIVIAQAALESGWGENVKGNNFFGIKSHGWGGATVNMGTHEVIGGKRIGITDSFRAYNGMKASVENYGQFLADNPRYKAVIGADAHTAANALQRAGYATDPTYAAKLKAIISSNNLTRLDDNQYAGYDLDEDRFEKTRQRLKQKRDENPEVWSDFMNQFKNLLIALLVGIGTALAGGNNPEVVAPTIRAAATSPTASLAVPARAPVVRT